jgi:hypothetical protein
MAPYLWFHRPPSVVPGTYDAFGNRLQTTEPGRKLEKKPREVDSPAPAGTHRWSNFSRHRDSPEFISAEKSAGLYPAWAACPQLDRFAELCKRQNRRGCELFTLIPQLRPSSVFCQRNTTPFISERCKAFILGTVEWGTTPSNPKAKLYRRRCSSS